MSKGRWLVTSSTGGNGRVLKVIILFLLLRWKNFHGFNKGWKDEYNFFSTNKWWAGQVVLRKKKKRKICVCLCVCLMNVQVTVDWCRYSWWQAEERLMVIFFGAVCYEVSGTKCKWNLFTIIFATFTLESLKVQLFEWLCIHRVKFIFIYIFFVAIGPLVSPASFFFSFPLHQMVESRASRWYIGEYEVESGICFANLLSRVCWLEVPVFRSCILVFTSSLSLSLLYVFVVVCFSLQGPSSMLRHFT